jgi:drug/metabolite transporter (DMT)-like permease
MKLARLLGPLWMMVFCVFLPLGDTLTRLVRESGMHVTQVIFIEYGLITMILLPFASQFGTTGLQDTTTLKWHLLRCLSFFGAALFWIGVLHLVPLTQLFAIGFLAPLFASGLSVFLLNERMTMPKLLCLLSGLAGTLVIIRPGFTSVSPYLLLGLLSPLCWAFTMVSTKKLTQTVSASMLLTIMSASTTVLSFPFALHYWTSISTTLSVLLGSIALIGLTVHFALIKAYEHSDITVLAPLEFSTLLFATVFSVVLFKEPLEIWTYIGALLIIVSNLYITFKSCVKA